MAIVSLKTPWFNADGLAVQFPTDSTVSTKAGERNFNGRHETYVTVDLTKLTTSNTTIVAETTEIPAGAFIEDIVAVVLKETTGSSSTLNFGLIQTDRSTEIDFDGFLAAAAAINAGTDVGKVIIYNVGTTGAGALLGTKTTKPGLLVASAGTAAFSAGVVELRVHWSVPNVGDTA